MHTPHARLKHPIQNGLYAVIAFIAVALCPAVVAQTVDTTPTASYIQNTGDKDNRVDLFFLGDGYTASELSTTYTSHINNVLDNGYFLTGGGYTGVTNPYSRYQNFINIIRSDIKSQQSGIDVQDSSGAYTSTVDTALDGRQGHPVSQAIFINGTKATNAINTAGAALGYSTTNEDWRLVFANTSTYAGTASGANPVFSADWYNAPEIALHEGGHTNHNLADEYTGSGTYTGGEPGRINVTKDPAGTKWAHWLGYNDPATGVVGAYEGALGYGSGVYRPSDVTIMNQVFGNEVFGPVSRENIILDIYDIVDPIDSHSDTGTTYGLFDDINVDVIDTNVINLEWIIDGNAITGQSDETLDLSQVVSFIGAGTHSLTARAYDTILDHNFSDNANPDPLDLVRRDLHKLEESLLFDINIDWLVGDTNFDYVVDQFDVDLVDAALGSTTIAGDAASGDLNGDGLVNQIDLDIVTAAVPEPTSFVSILAMSALLLSQRRRRVA